ncbi:hypothetical protein PPL_00491 [Heterostelium album PN500]|uniref:THH1/TOM1/TOM3 domain-containing protein n=1 Tax=Heterostelium pallidum (strain ATCC 26659 / Pp 5 / PN500) TaxID=670386 RepID=D3AWL6_HETP5|nr:hypothetical protein PPL_00491 [Heterostelium album PN500]EFA86689.1 hypothetical protein PPL_00491 [Heterostelium album PN500]|eukprot:XP_020438793.1 hypothetical protein PPL_00491 [Heterostelium album PN500]
MAWHYLNYDITHIFLTFTYMVLGAITVYAWYYRPTSNVSPIQKLFYPILLLGVLVRAVFMLMQPWIRESDLQIPNQANIVMNTLPSFLFFSNYLIVLFIWTEMYLIFNGGSMILVHRLPVIFNLIATLMYVTIIVLYALDFALYPLQYRTVSQFSETVEYIIGYYDGICFIVLALAFAGLGLCLVIKFRRPHQNFTEDKRKIILKRVSLVSLLVVVCFIIRAFITLFAVNRFNLISGNWWWFDGIYFFGFEVVPIAIMLYLLRMNNSNSQSPNHHIHYSTNTKKQDFVKPNEYTQLLHP